MPSACTRRAVASARIGGTVNGEDRLFAMSAELAQRSKEFVLPVNLQQECIRVSMLPMTFTSPWSYFEDGETGLDETADIELIEEQEDEEGDDDDKLA